MKATDKEACRKSVRKSYQNADEQRVLDGKKSFTAGSVTFITERQLGCNLEFAEKMIERKLKTEKYSSIFTPINLLPVQGICIANPDIQI